VLESTPRTRVPDTDGRRAGSGGSTIGCLREGAPYGSRNHRRQAKRCDSLPAYSPCGKICVPLLGDSDYDLRGVHILPAKGAVGLLPKQETIEFAGVRSGIDMDLVTHDVLKFFTLLLKRADSETEFYRKEYERLVAKLESEGQDARLPDEPVCREALNDLLVRVRLRTASP